MTATAPNPLAVFDPTLRADPYATYAAIRDAGPMPVPGLPEVVVFGRFDDCEQILISPLGSNDPRSSNRYHERVAAARPEERDLMERGRSFLMLDPPDHTRLRGLVSKAFTRRRVEALRPKVAALVEGYLDRIGRQDGTTELVSDLAYPLPVTVISDLLGVPVEDRDRFQSWSKVLAQSLDDGFVTPTPEQTQERLRAVAEFRAYFAELAAQRRREPADDLVTGLVQAEEAGDRLTEEELLSTCILLLIAGHETTVNLIANAVLNLLRHRDQWERLVANPSLAPLAVEETLRFDPPVQLTGRTPLEDLEVGGTVVPKGGTALCLLGAANRDPAVVDDPDRFDIGRDPNRYLSFGKGTHYCLGAPLAKLEAEVALEAFARRVRDPRLVTETPTYAPSAILRGVAELPLTFAEVRPA